MDMIFPDMAVPNLDVEPETRLPNQFASPTGHWAFQYTIWVFRHPDEVVLNIVESMGAAAVPVHDDRLY